MNGEAVMESPRLGTEGDEKTSRLSPSSIRQSCPAVNCCAIDTQIDADYAIGGPDPLMPLFVADAANLGAAFTEHALSRSFAEPLQKQATRPSPATPAPVKRIVGVEL